MRGSVLPLLPQMAVAKAEKIVDEFAQHHTGTEHEKHSRNNTPTEMRYTASPRLDAVLSEVVGRSWSATVVHLVRR